MGDVPVRVLRKSKRIVSRAFVAIGFQACVGGAWLVVAWSAWPLGPLQAHAQERKSEQTDLEAQEAEARAKELFRTGSALFDAGEYERSIEHFKKAYELGSRPALLYNISLGYERLGKLEPAIDALRKFLESGVPVANRERLAMRLDKMQERLEARHAREEAAASNEAAPSDEKPDESQAQPMVESRQDTAESELEPASPPDLSQEVSDRELTVPAIVSFAVAGAGAVTLAVFGPLALAKRSSLEDECAPACTDEQVEPVKTYRTVADVGLGVAVLGAAIGGVLWWRSGEESEEIPTQARFRPWAGPHGAGMDAKVRF